MKVIFETCIDEKMMANAVSMRVSKTCVIIVLINAMVYDQFAFQRQSKYCCSVSISDLEITSQSNTGLPSLAGTASMCSDCLLYNTFHAAATLENLFWTFSVNHTCVWGFDYSNLILFGGITWFIVLRHNFVMCFYVYIAYWNFIKIVKILYKVKFLSDVNFCPSNDNSFE